MIAVNFERGLVLYNNEIAPIDTMLDFEGEETDDTSLARAVICPLRNGQWLAVDVNDFEPAKLQ